METVKPEAIHLVVVNQSKLSNVMANVMDSRLIINSLGYLGLIPFVAGTWLIVTGTTLFTLDAPFAFISYSAIILTFLGGVLWGRGLAVANTARRNLLLLLSNVFALLAWFSLLGSDKAYSLSLISLALGYLFAHFSESRLAESTDIKVNWPYSKMRLVLTALAVITHVIVLLAV